MVPNRLALNELVSDLNVEDACIIVEGKRDVAALASLGIPRERIVATAQKRYCDLEGCIGDGHKKLIPLFDNDRTGERRMDSFKRYFSGTGYRIDESFYKRVRDAGLVCVEDIEDVLNAGPSRKQFSVLYDRDALKVR